MTSILSQNYAAALKILDFTEEFCRNPHPHHNQQQPKKSTKVSSDTSTASALFTEAVLSPSRSGATPIQALFTSLSPFYDIQSMRLYVSNLPVNYTAQHLLKLFQLRYPSTFKAEIVKEDVEEGVGSSEDEGWSSIGEEEEEGNGDEEGEESHQRVGERNLTAGMMHRSGKWSSTVFIQFAACGRFRCTCTLYMYL